MVCNNVKTSHQGGDNPRWVGKCLCISRLHRKDYFTISKLDSELLEGVNQDTKFDFLMKYAILFAQEVCDDQDIQIA